MAAMSNAQPDSSQVTIAKGTHVGRTRDHNEDYVDAFSPSDPAQRQQKGYLLIVADGMGGHQAGEVASESAVRVISQEYYADPGSDVTSSLRRAIQKANSVIHKEAQQKVGQIGMGTTIVAAVVRGQELYLANVGDSRAYLMRSGEVNQITKDHSFVEEQIRAGILTREEARGHPQRNVITRALGSKPEVKVDTYSGTLQPGDILLLCSDGLSEYVQEEDMLDLLSQYPPDEAVPRMIALANKRGGTDNISVLIARSGPPAAVPPAAPLPSRAGATRAGKDLPSYWLAVIGAALLVVVAVVAFIALFLLRGRLFGVGGQETPSPSFTPAASPSVSLSPSATGLPAISSPTTEATATPRVGVILIGPEPGELPIGIKRFSWKIIGIDLEGEYQFTVHYTGGVLCRPEEVAETDDGWTCEARLPVGNYEWWVKLQIGEDSFVSERRRLGILPPPSTATPTWTPEPPTATATDVPPPTSEPPGMRPTATRESPGEGPSPPGPMSIEE